jgi:hypothetical protein
MPLLDQELCLSQAMEKIPDEEFMADPDLGSEHRGEPIPPEPHSLVAD